MRNRGNYRGRWLRHPHTTQERRANGRKSYMDEDGFVVKFRPSRSMYNLPTAYDDFWIRKYAGEHVCWKNLRKSQYKPK